MRIWGVPLVLHYRLFLPIAVSCSCFSPYERLVLWALRRLRWAGRLRWNSVQICATLSLLYDLHAIFDTFRGAKLHESAVGILGAYCCVFLIISLKIWMFPEIGVPPNHQFIDGFSTLNYPFRVPPWMETHIFGCFNSVLAPLGKLVLMWGEFPGLSALLSWLWSLPVAATYGNQWGSWQRYGQHVLTCPLDAGAKASSIAVRISSRQQKRWQRSQQWFWKVINQAKPFFGVLFWVYYIIFEYSTPNLW